jgi:hypothetical protein
MPVYFIRAGDTGPVKIGWTGNVEVRRKNLQGNHVEPLHLLRVIEGSRQRERWLHRHFAALRLTGEWFRFDAEMLTIEPPEFNGLKPPKEPPPPKPLPALVSWAPSYPKPKPSRLISWAADRCTLFSPCAECRVP